MTPNDYNRHPNPSAPPYFTQTCIVCHNYENISIMGFPCGCTHSIHQRCVPIWRNRNDTCPTCRQIWINIMPPQAQVVHMPQTTYLDKHDDYADTSICYNSRCSICFFVVLCLFIVCVAIILIFFVGPPKN